MIATLTRIANAAARLPVFLAVTALFVMMVMTFADVILRSSFDAPIEAATEITRILMAVIVFSVLPVVSGQGGHIAVDLMDRFFGPALARWRDAALSLICGAALILPAERITVLAERARSYGDVTEYLGIPQFYIAWFIAIMVYITAAVLIVRAPVVLFARRGAPEPEGSGD